MTLRSDNSTPLRVAVDAHWLVSHPYKSIAIYLSSFLQGCARLQDAGAPVEIRLLLPKRVDDTNPWAELVSDSRFTQVIPSRRYQPWRSYKEHLLWNQVVVPRLAKRNNAEVIYLPYPTTPLVHSVPVVSTVHDVCILSHCHRYSSADRFFLGGELRSAVLGADAYVTASEYTARQFVKLFPSKAGKVTVGYKGLQRSCCDTRADAVDLPDSYFLWIGHTGARKRYDLVFEAYARYREQGSDTALVLIVPASQKAHFRACAERYGIASTVSIFTDVSEELKWQILSRAVAMIFPSECEGFGLPIFEAVIAGSLPVVFHEGPAGELLPVEIPRMHEMTSDEVVRLLHWAASLTPQQRVSLVQSSRRALRAFTDANMAAQILNACSSVTHRTQQTFAAPEHAVIGGPDGQF